MAKKTAKPETVPVLPLPDPVIEHHNQTLLRPMEQWLLQKHAPPVLLLCGPAGIGKRALCHYLAQWLLCEKTGFRASATPEETQGGLFGDAPAETNLFGESAEPPANRLKPCGECANCQKAIHGNWVDFNEIAAETGEGETGTLKIEQFRNLKASMGFGAFDGAFRITLIRDADRMTVQAANSLLKILEEPPPGWIFFLTATDPSLLLPTLVSRCQVLRLRPFMPEVLKQLLQAADVPADRQGACARLGQGSWGKALTFANNDFWEKREQIFRFFEKPSAEANGLIEWAAQEPLHAQLLLDQISQILSDLLGSNLDEATRDIPDLSPSESRCLSAHVQAMKKRLGGIARARDFWVERAERLFRLRQELLLPLNKKLLLQELLLPWMSR